MPVEELSLGALAHGVEAQQDLLQQFRCVELVAVPIVLSVLLLNEFIEVGKDGIVLGLEAGEVGAVADAPFGVQLAHHDLNGVDVAVGTTIIEYIRNTLKRVRKKESNLIMASQNLEDFDREGIRELTKPLFAIPPHQFIFNCGSIDKRFYMDLLQLEEAG